MSIKSEIQLDDEDRAIIAAEAHESGRHWREILKAKLRIVDSSKSDVDVIAIQRKAGRTLIAKCRNIIPSQNDSQTDLACNIDKILYECDV